MIDDQDPKGPVSGGTDKADKDTLWTILVIAGIIAGVAFIVWAAG